MDNKEILIKSVMAAVLAVVSTQAISATDATSANEKCYGIVKAGKNDCNTAKTSCAGSATKDKQSDAYVLMPKGLCEKLVDGHLEPKINATSPLPKK
jgi:uncharacterized membrane protein